VKPGKSIDEVDVRSVRKKMKDKAFARSVSREDIIKGAEQLGVNLDEHIATVIDGLRPVAGALGIAGRV
jgi:predicted hydrolase (HD superfamily)